MPPSPALLRRPRPRRRGLTLVEVLVALTVFGLVMLVVTQHLIECSWITLKTSRLLEYSRGGRVFIGQLGRDLADSQTMVMYPEFNDRATAVSASSYGNYLVMHYVNSSGTITRTIGYYAVPNGSTGTHILYRHDSADGVLAAGTLPNASTSGTHDVVIGTFRLPASTKVFRNWNARGVSIRGQYGTVPGASIDSLNYIQCTLTTRS